MIQYGSICEHYKKYRECSECSRYIKCPCGRTTYKCGFCKKLKENGWSLCIDQHKGANDVKIENQKKERILNYQVNLIS